MADAYVWIDALGGDPRVSLGDLAHDAKRVNIPGPSSLVSHAFRLPRPHRSAVVRSSGQSAGRRGRADVPQVLAQAGRGGQGPAQGPEAGGQERTVGKGADHRDVVFFPLPQ